MHAAPQQVLQLEDSELRTTLELEKATPLKCGTFAASGDPPHLTSYILVFLSLKTPDFVETPFSRDGSVHLCTRCVLSFWTPLTHLVLI